MNDVEFLLNKISRFGDVISSIVASGGLYV